MQWSGSEGKRIYSIYSNNKLLKAGIVLAACVVTIVVGFMLLWPGEYTAGEHNEGVIGSVIGSDSNSNSKRILMMGIDSRGEESGRADTIAVSKVSEKSVGTLSIPRDTRVEIPGHGEDKINHAYAYGGPELTQETASSFTGVETPNYIVLRMEGVREIVDTLDGVEINVPQKMTGTPIDGGEPTTLEKGRQTLNGKEALVYVRFRGDARGDIGRIERQQEFVYATIDQSFSFKGLLNAPQLYNSIFDNLEMNMSKLELLRLAARVSSVREDGGSTVTRTVPGSAQMLYSEQTESELSYWVPNSGALSDTVDATIR